MISPTMSRPRSDSFAAPVEGIRRAVSRANAAAASIAKGNVTPENMVELLQARTLVKANAAYVRTTDGLMGTLLNTLA